jgi:deoxyribodipyrimidine photolyase-related protein
VVRLVLVLGDQLTPDVAALAAADRARDVVVMAEVMGEGTSVPHHPQKIALILAAMRKFAGALERDGWQVAYSRLDDPENSQTIGGELLRRASEFGASEALATKPGEWRLVQALEDLPLPVTVLEDDRFLCPQAAFAAWAEGRKQLRMEWFYRDMRRRTGLLMEGGQPAGGQWNFDHDNRRPAKADLLRPRPRDFAPDPVVDEVLDLVEARFPHFGRLRPFRWATDRAGAPEMGKSGLDQIQHLVDHRIRRKVARGRWLPWQSSWPTGCRSSGRSRMRCWRARHSSATHFCRPI